MSLLGSDALDHRRARVGIVSAQERDSLVRRPLGEAVLALKRSRGTPHAAPVVEELLLSMG
jgi:hypothetical protein